MNSSPHRIIRRPRHRRGALYIAVLGASLIVAMLALGAIHGARINLRRSLGNGSRDAAARIAESGIEHALATIAADSNWRTNYVSGQSYPATPVSLGGGEFRWKLIDPDGNLGNDPADSVVIHASASIGDIEHALEVSLQPTDETSIAALESAFHCGGNITPGLTVGIVTNTFISSNANINAYAFGAYVDGDMEATGSAGGYGNGTATYGVPARPLPDVSVYDYYVNMGTAIEITQLPYDGYFNLENTLLSPTSNPWGATNAEGIYVIDCEGLNIRIRNARVVGTIVLLNAGSNSLIDKEVLLEPAINNFPSLLVQGNMNIQFDSDQDLDETTVNFNPPGTPYGDSEDNDTSDSYPSEVRGLVYVSGSMNFNPDFKNSFFHGCVVCGASFCGSDCEFKYRSIYANYPPPGFSTGSNMGIIPGSWKRIESP